jgi:hypothetical protein
VDVAKRAEEAKQTKVPAPASFHRMLSPEQVQEMNLGLPDGLCAGGEKLKVERHTWSVASTSGASVKS